MIRKTICFLTYHDYSVKELIPGFRKVMCKKCGRSWLTGDTIRDIPWVNDFELLEI